MESPTYWATRLLLQRGLAIIYLMAFLVALNQFRPLCGEKGLLPSPRYMRLVPFRIAPSLFYLFPNDRAFALGGWVGTALSLVALSGVSEQCSLPLSMLVWFLLWALYLSYVNIGQVFYGFGWESLLLEAGFLAIFLGPAAMEPPAAVIWLYRWLLFRVMLGAGLIKMRGDPCWRDLSCLDYHFETQPMPNPLSRIFHLLPPRIHRAGVLFNHLAELILPIFYFAPQPVAAIAGGLTALFLLSIIVSGNFSWLNWLTFFLCAATFSDTHLPFLHVKPVFTVPPPPLFAALIWGLVILVMIRSWDPVRNLISPGQVMNTSFDPFHLVNTYGAFGSITRDRYEIVLEGTEDEALGPATRWQEYEFRGKPGDPRRVPGLFAPYHLRLDWLMWFAAMPSRERPIWLLRLVGKLLEADRQLLGLLKHNPFPAHPPRHIRVLYYLYRFTTRAEFRRSGNRWHRDLTGDYLPPLSLSSPAFRRILAQSDEW